MTRLLGDTLDQGSNLPKPILPTRVSCISLLISEANFNDYISFWQWQNKRSQRALISAGSKIWAKAIRAILWMQLQRGDWRTFNQRKSKSWTSLLKEEAVEVTFELPCCIVKLFLEHWYTFRKNVFRLPQHNLPQECSFVLVNLSSHSHRANYLIWTIHVRRNNLCLFSIFPA